MSEPPHQPLSNASKNSTRHARVTARFPCFPLPGCVAVLSLPGAPTPVPPLLPLPPPPRAVCQVNFAPITRGTSATGYAVLYSAILAVGDEIVDRIPYGKQLDFEAMFTPNPDEFIERVLAWIARRRPAQVRVLACLEMRECPGSGSHPGTPTPVALRRYRGRCWIQTPRGTHPAVWFSYLIPIHAPI